MVRLPSKLLETIRKVTPETIRCSGGLTFLQVVSESLEIEEHWPLPFCTEVSVSLRRNAFLSEDAGELLTRVRGYCQYLQPTVFAWLDPDGVLSIRTAIQVRESLRRNMVRVVSGVGSYESVKALLSATQRVVIEAERVGISDPAFLLWMAQCAAHATQPLSESDRKLLQYVFLGDQPI